MAKTRVPPEIRQKDKVNPKGKQGIITFTEAGRILMERTDHGEGDPEVQQGSDEDSE
jgi:hypothetical protein